MIRSLIAAGIRTRNTVRESQRRRALANVQAAQLQQFRFLLSRGRHTAWGRHHGYEKVRTPAEFQVATPLSDYLSMAPWWKRYFDGERDVTWPLRPPYMAQTSGTTAGDKFIPVSPEMMASNKRAALDIFTLFSRRGKALCDRIFHGQQLMLGGSTSLEARGGGVKVGDLSAIATNSVFWPLSKFLLPSQQVALISDWEEKLDRVASEAAHKDVRFVTGMPSWMKLLFDRVAQKRGVAPEELTSKVWPNLTLMVHGGVNFAPYRPLFQQYWEKGGAPEFIEVYPASEGFIGIQSQAGDPGLEIIVDNGIFYEFVPLDRWGDANAPRLMLHEVEKDVPYVVILTTNAGLWSYDLGDVVRFVSLDPPKVLITGRHRHFINAFGENVIGEHIEQAMAHAQREVPCRVAEFTAGPRYSTPEAPVPGHDYVIEFEAPPADLDAFARALDAAMRQQSHDYDVKRIGDVGMTPLKVHPVARGTFVAWMKARGKLGGQNKVPRCANHRDYVEQLLQTRPEA